LPAEQISGPKSGATLRKTNQRCPFINIIVEHGTARALRDSFN